MDGFGIAILALANEWAVANEISEADKVDIAYLVH